MCSSEALLMPQLIGPPLNFGTQFSSEMTNLTVTKPVIILIQHRSVTDRKTDGLSFDSLVRAIHSVTREKKIIDKRLYFKLRVIER